MNRDLSVLGDIEHEWPDLKTMGIVASIRQESAIATEQDVSIRYYILRDPLINPPVHSHLLRAAQLEPWPLLRGVE